MQLVRLGESPQPHRQRLVRHLVDPAEIRCSVFPRAFVELDAPHPGVERSSQARRTRRVRRGQGRARRGRSARGPAALGGERIRIRRRPPSRRSRGPAEADAAKLAREIGAVAALVRRSRPRYSSSWNSVACSVGRLPSRAWARSAAYMPSGVWPVGRIRRSRGRALRRFATNSPPSSATRIGWLRTSGDPPPLGGSSGSCILSGSFMRRQCEATRRAQWFAAVYGIGPMKYGRIISLSSCSTMWQCHTNRPPTPNRALMRVISPG